MGKINESYLGKTLFTFENSEKSQKSADFSKSIDFPPCFYDFPALFSILENFLTEHQFSDFQQNFCKL